MLYLLVLLLGMAMGGILSGAIITIILLQTGGKSSRASRLRMSLDWQQEEADTEEIF